LPRTPQGALPQSRRAARTPDRPAHQIPRVRGPRESVACPRQAGLRRRAHAILRASGPCSACFLLQLVSFASAWRGERPDTCMPDLPTGTVTLLFTDMEDSTLLVQRLGDCWPDVLAACRRLLRAVFRHYHGCEVDTQGDAFFVVFPRATEAVAAAVAMQRALSSYDWGAEGAGDITVRWRVGAHTGEPQRTDEGYAGLDVHLAA